MAQSLDEPSLGRIKTLQQAIESLNQGRKEIRSSLKLDSPVTKAALATDTKAPEAERFLAATWLWKSNMVGALLQWGGKVGFLDVLANQPDLLRAWDLLSGDAWSPDVVRARDAIRLEIAYRLMDLEKMQEARGPVQANSPLNLREAVHLYLCLGHLGQWASMGRIQDGLSKVGADFSGIASGMNESHTFVDFRVVKEHLDEGRAPDLPSKLVVEAHEFKDFVLTPVSAIFSNELPIPMDDRKKMEEAARLRRPAPPRLTTPPLMILGAVGRWTDPASWIPLTGVQINGEWVFKGSREGVVNGQLSRQEETWVFKETTPGSGRFSGRNKSSASQKRGSTWKSMMNMDYELTFSLIRHEAYPR